jgi:hypothetical protein
VAPFGELADPRILAGLAVAAEERGWDGFFVWDHIVYRARARHDQMTRTGRPSFRRVRPALVQRGTSRMSVLAGRL